MVSKVNWYKISQSLFSIRSILSFMFWKIIGLVNTRKRFLIAKIWKPFRSWVKDIRHNLFFKENQKIVLHVWFFHFKINRNHKYIFQKRKFQHDISPSLVQTHAASYNPPILIQTLFNHQINKLAREKKDLSLSITILHNIHLNFKPNFLYWNSELASGRPTPSVFTYSIILWKIYIFSQSDLTTSWKTHHLM